MRKTVHSLLGLGRDAQSETLIFAARRHSSLYATAVSVCPSVRPSSVTRWYCVEMNKATIMRFSPSDSKIILVSGEVKTAGKFAGDHPLRGS